MAKKGSWQGTKSPSIPPPSGLLNFDSNIAVLKIFPGINKNVPEAIFNIKNLKAIVLESFGAGNGPTDKWFCELVKKAIDKGIIVLNVTQCNAGAVEQGKYETSVHFKKIGVIGGGDITYEAAITKLMFLLGQKIERKKIGSLLGLSLRGEIS